MASRCKIAKVSVRTNRRINSELNSFRVYTADRRRHGRPVRHVVGAVRADRPVRHPRLQ